MRRYFLVVLIVLVWSVLVFSADPITVPAEVKCKPLALVPIKAETEGKSVRWKSLDADLVLIPPEFLRDSKVCVAQATKPGRFRLVCWTAINGEPTDLVEVLVIAEGERPPDPKPPDPGPGPQDDLAKAIQAAYSADGGNAADKSEAKDNLSALYLTLATKVADKDRIKTVEDLQRTYQSAAKDLLPGDELRNVRGVVAKALLAIVGTDSTASIDTCRSKVVSLYKSASRAVEGCK